MINDIEWPGRLMMQVVHRVRAERALRTVCGLCMLLGVLVLAGCGTGGTPTEVPATPAPTTTATIAVMATETPAVEVPTETPAIPTPTPTRVAAVAPSLEGLIYRDSAGFWAVDAGQQAVKLIEVSNAVISADGKSAVYADANELWLVDLASGERTNLTQTADRHESNPQWWPGRPDLVAFMSRRLEGQEKPPSSEGYLAVVGVGGSGYRVLDDQTLIGGVAGWPALSPDGQTVAYSGGTTGLLYRWETGPEVFDPRDYGLSAEEGELRIAHPSWAPDGKRLAWVVHTGRQFGIAVFDLQAKTAWMGHFYDPVGMDGFPPGVAWSPDGGWLAVVAMAEHPAQMGLWVLDSSGQGEHRLARASNPVWSPDGNWLAFAGAPDEGEWRLWLAAMGSWELRPLSLPPEAYLAGWIAP